jgi:aminomethyltransferase
LIAFAGYEMPVRYSGVIEEHLAVRNAAGLFDVSHMGEFLVSGRDAENFLQYMFTNDVTKLGDGQAQYTAMCREDGGILDDLLVYRLSPTDYMLVVNASNIGKDYEWLNAHQKGRVELVNLSDQTALLALQGPEARRILEAACGTSFEDVAYYHFVQPEPGVLPGAKDVIVSATGYTGETGFEIYCESAGAVAIWESLLEAGEKFGLKPAGLSARDTLRMEAGFCLYGNDLTEETTPLEAGLGWITKLKNTEFLGSAALRQQKESGPRKRLVAFVMEDRGIPRRGYPIMSPVNEIIGAVTSGSQSPVLNEGIGLGYVDNKPDFTAAGQPVIIDVRGKLLTARIKKPPLHK